MRWWILLVLVAGCNSGKASGCAPSSGGPTEENAPIRELTCSKRGKRLGSLRFPEGGPPVLTVDAAGAEGEAFKASWEKLYAQGKIRVKIHEGLDDERRLVGIEAAPGSPSYGYVVQLKMAEEYAYSCDPGSTAD